MPVDWSKYPKNWNEIALAIKKEASWQCEKCGKQCRRPEEPFDTHKNTLTVAHCNHNESDCRPENLTAMCAPCHLRYDAPRKSGNKHPSRHKKQLKIAWNTQLNVK